MIFPKKVLVIFQNFSQHIPDKVVCLNYIICVHLNTNVKTPLFRFLVLRLMFLLLCFRIRSVITKCKENEIYIMQCFYDPHVKTKNKQVLKIRDRCLKECLGWVCSWKLFWVLTCSILRQIVCIIISADTQLIVNINTSSLHLTYSTRDNDILQFE